MFATDKHTSSPRCPQFSKRSECVIVSTSRVSVVERSSRAPLVQGLVAQYVAYLPASEPAGCTIAVLCDQLSDDVVSAVAAVATALEATFYSLLSDSPRRLDRARDAATSPARDQALSPLLTRQMHDLTPTGTALRCRKAIRDFGQMKCA